MAAQLENTHVLTLEGDRLVLGLSASLQFLYDQIGGKDFIAKLQAQLKTAWHKELEIQIKLGGQATTLSPVQAEEKRQQEEEKQTWQAVESHPLVKSAQKQLNVKIEAIKESK
jgi:hypothetical protein